MRAMQRWVYILSSTLLFTALLSPVSHALTVSASSDPNGLCTQTVSDTTGVIVTKSGSDCVVQFTSSSTLTWTPQYAITARYLLVGSGGSGTRGYCSYYWGQGGGGGEVLTGTGKSFSGGVDVSVTVAAASGRSGACTQVAGANGSSSTLGDLVARGGKASLNSTANNAGAKGGDSGNGNPGGIGTANGGHGCSVGNCQVGGGGGAGAAGSGTNGGAGINSDIVTIGTNVMYGSGGAGWAGAGDAGTATSGGATPGSAACDAPVNRGGGGADCLADATGGSGGSGFVVIRYTYNNPPIIGAFSSEATATYSANENSTALYSLNVTDADAGASLTYSLTGADSNDFTLSSSGVLTFTSAPDFEAPTDSDSNTVFLVVTWVSDGFQSDSQTVTISLQNLNEAGTITKVNISGSAYKGTTKAASVTVNTAGKVRFFINGKRIAGCLSVSASGSYPTFTATCNWKPTFHGRQLVTAQFMPTDTSFSTATSQPLEVWVLKRVGLR